MAGTELNRRQSGDFKTGNKKAQEALGNRANMVIYTKK